MYSVYFEVVYCSTTEFPHLVAGGNTAVCGIFFPFAQNIFADSTQRAASPVTGSGRRHHLKPTETPGRYQRGQLDV